MQYARTSIERSLLTIMMKPFIHITSEIGKLKKVMLHRPGRELENLVPEELGRLLFDDIPYLKIAQEEHDNFAKVLRDRGVEVYYLNDLLAEVLKDDKLRDGFLREILKESRVASEPVYDALYEYLSKKPVMEMIECIEAGVRKDEVEVSDTNSLSYLIDNSYFFYLDPMPNLYFTRDPSAAMADGLTINRMRMGARRRESLFMEYIYRNHPSFAQTGARLFYDRTMENNIEGGDETVLSDKVLAVGCSQRTSAAAIEILARNLLSQGVFERVLVFQIPECRAFMHLDTVFTMVDYDKFVVHPGVEGPLNVYEITPGAKNQLKVRYIHDVLDHVLAAALKLPKVDLIKCGGGDRIISGREQWNDGSNMLAVAPGRVISYERNYVSNSVMRKHGIDVTTIPSSELSRGRGGPRCMSMPLNREEP